MGTLSAQDWNGGLKIENLEGYSFSQYKTIISP
jgi:hypothetical protein